MDSSLQECFISLITPNFLAQQMLHYSVYADFEALNISVAH
jgi:hypothetical protein